MSKVHVISAALACLAFSGATAAMASPAVGQSDARASRTAAPVTHASAPEGPVAPAAAAVFGDQVEQAIDRAGPVAQMVRDPSGRFVVRVAATTADGGRVLSVTDLGSNRIVQEWRLSPTAQGEDVRLALFQVMTATGQSTPDRKLGSGALSARSGGK